MRSDEQGRIGRGHLPDVVAGDIRDNKNPRLPRIIERRGDAGCGRARRQVAEAGAGFGATPGLVGVGGAVGQGRRGDE